MEQDKGMDIDMENVMERFEEFLLRAERFGERFSKQAEAMAAYEQGMARLKKELTLEIEELRSHRHALEHDLKKNINKAIQETIQSVLPEQMPGLVKGFVSKAESASEATIKKAEQFNDRIEKTVKRASDLIETHKILMTWRQIYLAVSVSFSIMLTAFGVYYFFPTHTHIHYDMSDKMMRSYFLGESINKMRDGFLTPRQKEQMNEELEKIYRGVGNE